MSPNERQEDKNLGSSLHRFLYFSLLLLLAAVSLIGFGRQIKEDKIKKDKELGIRFHPSVSL